MDQFLLEFIVQTIIQKDRQTDNFKMDTLLAIVSPTKTRSFQHQIIMKIEALIQLKKKIQMILI